jgi:putative hydrolase of the HAD superfamily
MDLRALLFDVNGTLVEIQTDEGMEEIYRAIAHVLTYQGITLHREQVRDLYGQILQQQRTQTAEPYAEWNAVAVWRDLLWRTASAYTQALPSAKLEQLPYFLAELHRGIARKRLRLYQQVREVLDQLRQRYLLAVVSDAQSAYAVPELHAVGLLGYFHTVIISGDYGYRKPDPRLFQHALDHLEVRPEQAIFIGNDLYRDVFGPQQVGMKAIWLAADTGQQAPVGVEPDYAIAQFAELPEAIEILRAR